MARFKNEEVLLSVLQEDVKSNVINKKLSQSNNIDWQALYKLAIKNGLLVICYTRLLNLENIPQNFLLKLKDLYLLNLKRNLVFQQELFKVLFYLKKFNLPAIPLKGPILARYLYNDLAFRQTLDDLDLLVQEERVVEVKDRLAEIGYSFYFEQEQDIFFYKFRRQIKLKKELGQVRMVLDLHWDFRDKFTPTHIKEFWSNARYINLDGYQILMPSYEDLLLYLSLTTISDYDFIHLKYIYDIQRMIILFGKEIDWKALIGKARKFELGTALFFSLELSKELFHADIPEYLLNKLRPKLIKKNLIGLWVNKKNVLYKRDKIASSYTWSHLVSSYIYSRSIFDCLRIIYKKTFLPMEEVMGRYSQPLSKASYYFYVKRLLKPVKSFFRKSIRKRKR